MVPLCGKAYDLKFLADQGHEVVGIELVRSAIEAFFEEHKLTPEPVQSGPYQGLRSDRITLWAGDYFASSSQFLGRFDALYDRAAQVALPQGMREAYARHALSLLAPHARIVLISFEYDTTKREGPPFSIDEAQVRALYPDFALSVVDETRYQRGGTQLLERMYTLDLPS